MFSKKGILWTATLALIASFFTINVQAEIARFLQVDQQIYRGGQPETKADYDRLQQMGIKYVFNLRDDYDDIVREQRELEKRGMVLLSYPMNPWDTPDAKTVKYMLYQIAEAQKTGGVFVHCHHGKDRTGVIMGLYRIHFQRWDRMKAYSELASFGFNHIFWDLLDFYWVHSLPGALNKIN